MSTLRPALADYLALRRGLGFQLKRAEKLLGQFLGFLDQRQIEVVTVAAALDWAQLPAERDMQWWAHRLGVVRQFAIYLHARDPRHEVPPRDVLPEHSSRANPYLYTGAEIAALMGATATLRFPLRAATYRTLIGLLAVTGMRVGEAIALDTADFDPDTGILTVRDGKTGTRHLPLHPTTTEAVGLYLARPDRTAAARCPALLISPAGTRLLYCNVHSTWLKLVSRAGIRPRSTTCRPRIHDVRHSFAVEALLDAYRHDLDIDRRLTLLATYLGHVSPAGTYWYLSAAPELMGQALARLNRQGDRR